MKRNICIIILLLFAIGLFGCGPEKVETYEFNVPSESKRIGYSLNFDGTFYGDNNNIAHGEDIKITIQADQGYTLADIVVKDNDMPVQLIDASTNDYYDNIERVEFMIKDIQGSHKITIEGVREKELAITLKLAKYGEDENDIIGKTYTEYNDRYVIIRYGDKEYWGKTIESVFNEINEKNITYKYGEIFTLWIYEQYRNCYSDIYGNTSLNNFYSATSDFNGIFGYKLGDEYKHLFNVAAYRPFTRDDDGEDLREQGMYKLEVEVKQDMDLYFNTLELKQAEYEIEYIRNEMWDIKSNLPKATFDTEYTFTIELLPLKATDANSHLMKYGYDFNYDDMKIYVNGSETGVDYDKDSGECTFIVYPPSIYHMTGNYDKLIITIDGITWDENAEDLVKIKADTSSEEVFDINYYRKYAPMSQGIQDLDYKHQYQMPYYYEDGEYYYRKSDEPFITFNVDKAVDEEDIIIAINGELVQDITLELLDSDSSGGNEYRLDFGADYIYPNEMIINILINK